MSNIKKTFVLPVYYTIERKTKKNSTHLIGANWLRNVHYHVKNQVKQYLAGLIHDQITEKFYIKNKYKVTYTYYYKNKRSDLMNVISATSKALLDSLQECECIDDDSVEYCIEEVSKVGGLDKNNPRVEIILEEINAH